MIRSSATLFYLSDWQRLDGEKLKKKYKLDIFYLQVHIILILLLPVLKILQLTYPVCSTKKW